MGDIRPKDRIGLILLVLPLVAVGFSIITTVTRLMGFRLLGLLFVAPACAIVVFVDAFRGRKNGSHPFLMFIGVLLLWIVFYPLWMFRRSKLVPGARPRGILALILTIVVGAFSVGLVERLAGAEPIPWEVEGDGDSDWDDD
jgi:hypothetical protein